MALFEKTVTNKVNVDDTHKLRCAIENANNINKHTEYCIKVCRGPGKDVSWSVCHRYNDFASLNSCLQHADVSLPLPPKKIIGNMQPGFIAQRQVLLQAYLDAIMKNTFLASSLPVKAFLDPNSYSHVLCETALQNVCMALRGDGNFEMKSSLPNIGWRIRKHYYTVSQSQLNGDEYVMSWQTYGPDKVINERDMQAAFKCLMNLQHPYIDKIVYMHSLEAGAYVVRKLHSCGTMKDYLYGSQYSSPYLAKYANPKQRKPFTMGQIAHYGYQILQALKYLHSKGFPYGHLHTGNIAIENQKVQLLDIENCILGVPLQIRDLILDLKRVNTMEAVDVYCFGHTLYEMTFGEPLLQSTCDNYPTTAANEIIDLLQMILSPSACKRGLPSLDSLLVHPFFSTASSLLNGASKDNSSQCHLKVPIHIKEQIRNASESTLTRLKQDQRTVKLERRQNRIQEILNSEEEIRKRKRKKNKENSMSQSQSLLNGFSQNGLSPWTTLSERADSVTSTLSTESSATPPHSGADLSAPSTSSLATPCSSPPFAAPRSALLSSICAFNKKNLHKVKE